MPDMRRFLDLAGLEIYDAKIKEVISTGDASALADAKKYFDDNKGLFEAAGAVETARKALQAAIDAVDAKVGQITDGESIDSFADVETALAGKQDAGDYATKTEAQGYADAKDAAIQAAQKAGDDAQAAADAAQGDVDALAGKVGTVPEDQTVMGIIANIQESAYDDTELRGLISGLDTNKADKTQVATDIGAAKTELEGKITAAQTAADNAQSHSEGVAGDLAEAVEALEGADAAQVERIAALEGTIVGLSGAMHFEGVKDAVPEDVTGYEQGDVIIVGNKEYVLNGDAFVEFGDASVNAEAITALTGRVGTLETDMGTAKTDIDKVEAAVAAKAEQTYVDEQVQALQGVDTGLDNRIKALEAKHGDGEGTVESLIATAKQEAVDAAAGDATTKANQALADAKAYADTEDAKIESRVDALETASATHALKSEVEAVTGDVEAVEGRVDTLETEMDAVQALAEAADAAAKANAGAIALKAAQADLDAANGRIDGVVSDLEDLTEVVDGKVAQGDFDTLAGRVTTAEGNISANAAAIAKFVEISESEINALFTTGA